MQVMQGAARDPAELALLAEGARVNWFLTWRADPVCRMLADRHYSRKTIGAAQFAPPGRNVTLRTVAGDACWSTSWPLPEYVDHAFGDCWTCTLFRNESRVLSSELIREAMAATAYVFDGEYPTGGFLTFVDPDKVRRKRDPGRCFLRAGFEVVGETKHRHLIVLRCAGAALSDPAEPLGQLTLGAVAELEELRGEVDHSEARQIGRCL